MIINPFVSVSEGGLEALDPPCCLIIIITWLEVTSLAPSLG